MSTFVKPMLCCTLCVLLCRTPLGASETENPPEDSATFAKWRGMAEAGGVDEFSGPDQAPKVRDKAPDFTLAALDGESTLTLSQAYRKRPVVLLFGSYTCPPFRNRHLPGLQKLYLRYKDQMDFYMIYIKEAHTSDGWQVRQNIRQNVVYDQPATEHERASIARTCRKTKRVTMPILVDDIENHVCHLYAGWPNRAFLIDSRGTVLYRGSRGPYGADAGALRDAIDRLLTTTAAGSGR